MHTRKKKDILHLLKHMHNALLCLQGTYMYESGLQSCCSMLTTVIMVGINEMLMKMQSGYSMQLRPPVSRFLFTVLWWLKLRTKLQASLTVSKDNSVCHLNSLQYVILRLHLNSRQNTLLRHIPQAEYYTTPIYTHTLPTACI